MRSRGATAVFETIPATPLTERRTNLRTNFNNKLRKAPLHFLVHSFSLLLCLSKAQSHTITLTKKFIQKAGQLPPEIKDLRKKSHFWSRPNAIFERLLQAVVAGKEAHCHLAHRCWAEELERGEPRSGHLNGALWITQRTVAERADTRPPRCTHDLIPWHLSRKFEKNLKNGNATASASVEHPQKHPQEHPHQ